MSKNIYNLIIFLNIYKINTMSRFIVILFYSIIFILINGYEKFLLEDIHIYHLEE